jgi:eukaryotic-like serine/threonine-protein kinase
VDLLAGRYELAEPLGAGGMARVMAAHDHRLGRRVAVKLVREELTCDPVSRERLLREARAAAALQHPNTVAVHDAGEQDGQAFVVMELVAGRTLGERLRTPAPLPAPEVVALGAAVLAALQAAHARGLVHRDVKPANVLLTDDGGVKLADFGIAKALDGAAVDLTATGQVLGTPRYLAPEQVAGAPATPASDLYSLGAVLYECLAGRPPFEADSAVAVALAHQQEPVPPLLEQAPGVPVALARVVERALAKDPGHRWADAVAMRTALEGPDLAGHAAESAATVPTSLAATGGGVGGAHTDAGDTGVLPVTERPPPNARRWWAPAGGVAVLVAVGALAMLGGGEPPGDGPGPEEAAPSVDAGPAAPDGAGGVAPSADVAEGDAGPTDLADLAAQLARDPDAAGERGADLLEDLLELRGESGDDRREDARELIRDVAEWLAEGEVDREVAGDAVRLLEIEGRPADGGLVQVSELFGRMALELDAWGDKADSLHGDLEDLLDEDPEDRAEEAGKLLDKLERRLEKGEIDAARGREAIEVLRSVSRDAP